MHRIDNWLLVPARSQNQAQVSSSSKNHKCNKRKFAKSWNSKMTKSKTRAGSLTKAKRSTTTPLLKMNLCRLESEEKTLSSMACQRHIFHWSTHAPMRPTQRQLLHRPTMLTVTSSSSSNQPQSLSPGPTKTAQNSTSTRPLHNQET